jgi:hypothetical protein
METLPDASVAVEKPQPRLMHERRGLKRLPGRLSGHVRRRQPAQFIINQRQQFVGGTAPGIQRLQNAGDVSKTVFRCSPRNSLLKLELLFPISANSSKKFSSFWTGNRSS